jgi:hypothetical protein
MSYMNHDAAFAPAGGIQELSFDEVDAVAGGPVSASTVLAVGAAVVGGAGLILAAPAIVGVTGAAATVYFATAAVLALASAGAALVE